VELCIEDDGVGFDGQAQFDLVSLLANKNFGLAGMHERATLIGAQVNIKTAPGQGTLVQVVWCAN
jgi:signal transduction histidine kinase